MYKQGKKEKKIIYWASKNLSASLSIGKVPKTLAGLVNGNADSLAE